MGLFKRKRKIEDEFVEDLEATNESESNTDNENGVVEHGGMASLFSDYTGDIESDVISTIDTSIIIGGNVSEKTLDGEEESESFIDGDEFAEAYEKAHSKHTESKNSEALSDDDILASFLADNTNNGSDSKSSEYSENATDEASETTAEPTSEICDETDAGICDESEHVPTTDELIEEFIKNGGFAAFDSVEDTEQVPTAEPEFVLDDEEEQSQTAAELDCEELPTPEELDDIDFNTADTDGVGTTDMNLRIAFGLEEDDDVEEELSDAVKKLGDRLESNRRVGKKIVSEHAEYTDPIQARDIAGEYKKRRRGVSVRLFFAFIPAILLLIFENISVITELITGTAKQFAGPLDPAKYPVVYIMVSLQLLLLCAVLALPELRHGAKRLFSGAPTPESITLLLVATGIGLSAVSAYFAKDTSNIVTYNAVSAASVIMTLIYSRLNIKREMMTFYVVGSKKRKYAMKNVPDEESLLDMTDCDEDMYGDVMRVEQCGFIDGFFSRISTPDTMTGAFVAGIMAMAVAAAVLFGIFTSRSGSDVVSTASNIYLALIAMTPFALQLTFSYPFYRASLAASENDSAIVGECSLDEYASAAVVSFDDGNLFPSFGVKVQNIRIYNNARIDRVLYYASSVFKSAGGPLSDVFEVATMEMGRSDSVEIIDADTGYLEARVDGVRIVFGSRAALGDKGYEIADSIALDDVDFSDELSIMYMFREDMLISKMYIKYVLDGDTESMLRQFRDYGMYLCVRTYDPNIDEDMICSKLEMNDVPLKVVRYRSADDVKGSCEKTDSGFVTYSSPKTLLQLLPFCDKVIHTKRTCAALTVMSIIISIMLIAVLTMSSGIGFLRGIHVIAWHIVWMLPAYIASKIFIR